MLPSILHIAPQNFAGVPQEIVKAERARGFRSWLVTMWPHPYGFGEDECLDLPLTAGKAVGFAQRLFKTTPKTLNERRKNCTELPPRWRGGHFPANALFAIRDALWIPKLKAAGFPERLKQFDIIVLDGGLGLLRSGRWILEWARNGGHLVTTYYGSDLRSHGVIPELDSASGAVFVMEFDHIALHPRATWLPFPFDLAGLPAAASVEGAIRIGHVASTRSAKGTARIIEAISQAAENCEIEPVIIERKPHAETLRLKSTCQIFVDQIGELGYGISGLESLAMGIPTVVELLPDHETFLGEHPFVVATSESLPRVLADLALNKGLRAHYSKLGAPWVSSFHSPSRTVDIIVQKYAELGWL